MKTISSAKSIKFALILSVASFMGMQASQATQVYCPAPKDLVQTHYDWHSGIGTYTGNSTPKKFTFKGQSFGSTPEWMVRGSTATAAAGARCDYEYNGTEVLMLGADDAGAKRCQPVPNSNYFDCASK